MWFLIKTAFWFSLVLVLLPIFSTQSTSRLQGTPQVEMSDAVNAATGAFQYVSSICSEKPEVCVKGGETFTALGYRAREGARVAYEFIDQQLKPGEKPALAADAGIPQAVDPMMIAKGLASATMQPMPAKPAARTETADAVVTGTIKPLSFVPVPQRRPTL